MSKGYTKLFNKIVNSSIWDEDDKTRLVWITMLALADADGQVLSTLNGIALNARVTKADAQKAIDKFLAPDPESTSKAHEGRRVQAVDGGWLLLNHGRYREMMSLEERREYFRKKRAEYRALQKSAQKGMTARQIIKQRMDAESEKGLDQ